MTMTPREKREYLRDPLARGEVRIAAVAAAMRAVKAERDAKPAPRQEQREEKIAPTVQRAA